MTQSGGVAIFALLALLLQTAFFGVIAPAEALGVAAPVPMVRMHPHMTTKAKKHTAKTSHIQSRKSHIAKRHPVSSKKRGRLAHHVNRPLVSPLSVIPLLSSKVMAPGVIYRQYRSGALSINVIDADLVQDTLQVRPVLACGCFNCLTEVRHHARQSNAIAAVNANYFKKDGTPLGTLIIDKEWVSGPLYDRVSMGITASGYVKIDRVNLYGTLQTSNPEAPSVWVNNINQPRRSGSRLIVYTQRWGRYVRMPYVGTLVAVDKNGEVIDKGTQVMEIPWGGYVLCDSRQSPVACLTKGDKVSISWHTRPDNWDDVVQAVSGGPMLIRNNQLYLDLKDEQFKHSWTSSSIKARTAAGVTADNHLLLVTIEGGHTLWDMAKFLHKLGAVEAMNLDGGGSTTMVVNGVTVTRNANAYQRRVASALAIVAGRKPAAAKPPSAVPGMEIIEQATPVEQTMSQPAPKSEGQPLSAIDTGNALTAVTTPQGGLARD
jgi:uncharacterized protein YigE (DUF2233 family)